MNHERLAELALKAQRPLKNKTLEAFQAEYFGKFRHWYYRFFYHLVAEMKPAVALEIGVHHGHGVIHMAYGHHWTIAVGMDILIGAANVGYAPGNCILLGSHSLYGGEAEIKEIVKKHGPIGVVFQDSSHHYHDSHKEFEIYSQYLEPGAVWCCDDIMDVFHDPQVDPPGKSMLTYFNELPGDKRLYDKLHHGSVIGITIL